MSTLTTTALVLGSLAGIVTAIRVITGWGPLRWLWRHLVHVPVREGLRAVIADEVRPLLDDIHRELSFNSGKSVKDVVHSIAAELKTLQQNMEAERR